MTAELKGSRNLAATLAVCLSAAALCLSLASQTTGPHLSDHLRDRRANRLPGKAPEGDFTVVFYSDPHAAHERHSALCDRMLEFDPALAVLGGDCVNDGVNSLEWAGFMVASHRLRTAAPLLPVKGNHDRGGLFEELFELPGGSTSYSLDFGPLHLVVLDTQWILSPESPQFAWLEADLAGARQARFTLVFHHQPILSSGRFFQEIGAREMSHLPPLFAKYGVELSASGHEHFYERLEQEGTTYVVADCGGWGFRTPSEFHPASRVLLSESLFCVFKVSSDAIEGAAVGLDGRAADRFVLKPR